MILRETRLFLSTLKFWLVLISVLAFYFFAAKIPLGLPVSVWTIQTIKSKFLAENIGLIVVSPYDGFVAQISISIFLAFVVSMPVLIYKLILFISPALNQKERAETSKVLVPTFLLFLLGAIFAYEIIAPATLDILYSFAINIGASSFITIKGLVNFVLGIVILTGIIFQIPVVMYLLTKVGIVKANVWRRKWRYAVLIFLILTAIITPDNSGVTMILLFLPLIFLYFLGFLFIK